MVSPLVVKLALADLEHSGHTVGTIYAASTVGSIVGTFITGFWLISWLGTRSIVWLVAAILLLTGLSIGRLSPLPAKPGAPRCRRRRGAGPGGLRRERTPPALSPETDRFGRLLLMAVVWDRC